MHQTITIAIVLVAMIALCAIAYRIIVAMFTRSVLRHVAARKKRAKAKADKTAAAVAAMEAGEVGEVVLEDTPAPVPAPVPAPAPAPAAAA